jgi:long-chain acyl-CoA synthetase
MFSSSQKLAGKRTVPVPNSQMLYERWREVVRDFADEIALRDLASGQRWTFAQLDSLAGSTAEGVVFPQGSAVEFISAVLTGWKTGAVVCPLEAGQPSCRFPEPPKTIVHVKATSASTGPARLAAFTASQLAADARNIIATMGLRREWPNLGVISLAHSYGFSNLITPLLLHGIPLVVTNSPLPESIGSALREVGGATLAGVPALWRAWFDAGVLSSNVRLAISAGAPLPVNLEREIFEQCGIKVHNFYGSTECGGIAYDRSPEPRTDASYAGVPMHNVQLSIAGDGCLEVQSDAVGETYWPEASDRLAQRRFRTTDLAEIADTGIYLRGRATDVINVAGRKISPELIESVILKHPAVRQCVVFGVPEADRERIVACVVAEPPTTAENLKEFVLTHLQSWQVPRDFWVLKDLPTDHRGKLSRASLRERYLAR